MADSSDTQFESIDNSREYGYLGVDPGVLITFSPLKADIYVRLSADKFVKILRAGDAFGVEDVRRFKENKGLKNLYLLEKDIQVLVEKVEQGLDDALKQPGGTTPAQASRLHQATYSLVHDVGDQIGITKEIQQVTKKQVQTTISSIRHDWRVSTFLKELTREGGYLAWHSLSLSYMSCLVLNKTQWQGEQNMIKFGYAALIHDITLRNQELAELTNMKEFEERKDEFTPDDQKSMLYHTIRAAERVKSFDAIPPDVDTIVLQHHERPDGSGFPRKLKYPQITPLASVFVVAHEYLTYNLRQGREAPVSDFLNTVEHWCVGHFAEVLESIRFE
jgi:hypothetical protein